MKQKLLVITAGTVAASIGRTLQKQMQEHPNSELTVMVRFIDTAYLPNRESLLRHGEWFHLSIDERFMRAVYQNQQKYPRMERMLYDGLLPGTAETGGSSIRYNGAGAVEIKRDELRDWLMQCMTELSRADDRSTNISVALIVSSVGATGSGSLEHLIDLINEASNYANIRTTERSGIRCDTYILQPSQDVTNLGLANTLALFAEIAASQLINDSGYSRQGRNILIGWSSDKVLRSIDQMCEGAATIIRLINDPSSYFWAEYREREVDNHVLRELDPLSELPMHLSLAAAVSINLEHLNEQIIQRDVTRLVNNLIFGKGRPNGTNNVLLGKFADALAGEDAESRYQTLLEYLAEAARLGDVLRRIDITVSSKGIPDGEKGARLNNLWQEGRAETSRMRPHIQDFAQTFTSDATKELERAKGERISRGGVSLIELREEYRALQYALASTLEIARADTRTSIDAGAVTNLQRRLNAGWPLNMINRSTTLRQLAGAMKRNLYERLQENTRSSAIHVLERLEQRCEEIGRNLDIVLNKLRRKRDDDLRFVRPSNTLSTETGNPMNIVALNKLEDINAYAAQVSIFTSEQDVPEQLAEFRLWLQGRPELEALFKGNLEQLMGVVTSYTQEKVSQAVNRYSILDILHRSDEVSLQALLRDAADKASALISYNRHFAPELREAWHVSAFYRNDDEREELVDAMKEAFAQEQCTLLKSSAPGEIAVFYYVDGIPMPAVNDLTGRCLEAFLERRIIWEKQREKFDSTRPISTSSLNQRIGLPVYSGKDAEQRVIQTGVIRRLYSFKGLKVGDYSPVDLPELRDEEWETLEKLIRPILFRQSIINSSSFSKVPRREAELLFKRYIQEHPDIDLEYQESTNSLQLSPRVINSVKKVYGLLDPIVAVTSQEPTSVGLRNGIGGKSLEEFEIQLEEFFHTFSLATGLNIKYHQYPSAEFATFLIDTETIFENIRIPNSVLALVCHHSEISPETRERVRNLLVNKKLSAETQIVIMILFCKTSDLDNARRLFEPFSATYARDIVVLNQDDLMDVVAAKEPMQAFRRLVLSQVNLAAVHPFVTDGPTPPYFFFGRESQLREISDRAATKSFALIGGRRIGKSSILNRLLHIQLAERFSPFLLSCQSIDKREPTKADFLAISNNHWRTPAPNSTQEPIESFSDIVRALSGNKPLVFLIDEADRLVPADSIAGWPLFGEMRALAEEGRCQFVFAGEYGLSQAMSDSGSPFHNFASKIPIGCLDELAVTELVINPMTQLGIKLVNPEAIVERIYQFTSGHPNIVQRLCQRLINMLSQSRLRQITSNDVESIISLREFQEDDFLDTFWERATVLERIISLLLAQNSGQLYTLHDIRQMLSEHFSPPPQVSEVGKALRRLTELRNILARTPNGYTLAVEAFPLVVGNTITAEDALEDLIEIYKNYGDVVPKLNLREESGR